jgi:hypothetical protein
MKPGLAQGQKVGQWTLVAYEPPHYAEGKRVCGLWRCRCECGNEAKIRSVRLRSGESTKCKACADSQRTITPLLYEAGQRIGEWTLLEYQPGRTKGERRSPKWKCACSCGVVRMVDSGNLYSGQSKSCGHNSLSPAPWRGKNLRPVSSVFQLGGSA